MYFGRHIREAGLKPYLVSWTIGFTRYIDAFMDMGLLDGPAYVCFCLTDNTWLGGHPARSKACRPSRFPAQGQGHRVDVVNFGGNLFSLAGAIIAQGGHISIGLGDHTYRELGLPTNADLVRKIAELARDLGREIATPEEAKAILGMTTTQHDQARRPGR